jgi:AraC-like DNA-binding protein
VILLLQGQEIYLAEGDFAWVPSNWVHAYRRTGESVVDVCVYSEDFVGHFSRENQGLQPERFQFRCRASVAEFADRELFAQDRTPGIYEVKAALYAILGDFSSQVNFSGTVEKRTQIIDRLTHYVVENHRENITLKSAAKALGYEEHYLSRCFHQVIPMHFSRYVNLYRVDTAMELLQNENLTMGEIAESSGFQSVRSFNRAFRMITGKAPSDVYRQDS